MVSFGTIRYDARLMDAALLPSIPTQIEDIWFDERFSDLCLGFVDRDLEAVNSLSAKSCGVNVFLIHCPGRMGRPLVLAFVLALI